MVVASSVKDSRPFTELPSYSFLGVFSFAMFFYFNILDIVRNFVVLFVVVGFLRM